MMPITKWHWTSWVLAGAFIAMAITIAFAAPMPVDVCDTSPATNGQIVPNYDCHTYRVVVGTLVRVMRFGDTHQGFFIALFTLGLFTVGVAQAGLFWWQLGLIRESLTDAKLAAEAAKKSADQTEASVTLARATAKQELRAYLGVREGRIEFRQTSEDSVPYKATVPLKNWGHTPAYNVRYSVNIESIPKAPVMLKHVLPAHTGLKMIGTFQPQQEHVMHIFSMRRFTKEELAAFDLPAGNANLQHPCVYGTIWYTDAYGDDQTTEFAYWVNAGPSTELDIWNAIWGRNKAT